MQAGLHLLGRAVGVARPERGEDAEGGPHAGALVDDRRADPGRGAEPGSPLMLMTPEAACTIVS